MLPSIAHSLAHPLTPEGTVNDAHGYGDEPPAEETDVGLLAARSDIVVVRHVNIKHQLFLHRLEVGLLHSVLHGGLKEVRLIMHSQLLWSKSWIVKLCSKCKSHSETRGYILQLLL